MPTAKPISPKISTLLHFFTIIL